jgi:hypothetical protein
MVRPPLTHVIVFFVLIGRTLLGEGDGEGDGSMPAISALLIVGVGFGVAVGEAVAITSGDLVGSASLSYITLPNPAITPLGKFAGSGVSDKCFITDSTSGLKFGKISEAPLALTPARRVRISVRRLL